MPIASYQGKVFQVSSGKTYTLDGLVWSGSLETESQEKLQDKPSTYIKGDGLQTMSFSIPLIRSFNVDIRGEIESWESLKSKAAADFFILGGNPLGKNKWLLKSVDVSGTQLDGNGQLTKATIKLDFEEYVRAGQAKPPQSGSAISTTSNLSPTSYVDKTAQKRSNPNSKEARLARVDNLYSIGV